MTRPPRRPSPAAGPADLAKWERLIAAVLAAVEDPALTKPLVKARNATRKGCLVPAGQFWVGSPFHRFSEMSVLWTSVGAAQRVDLSSRFKGLALECREILERARSARGRADIEE